MIRISMFLVMLFGFVAVIQAPDPILTPEASGKEVVDKAIAELKKISRFADDHGFMARIAQVESKCGTDGNTFSDKYFGGIWRVDEGTFDSSRDPSNHENVGIKINAIKTELGIDLTLDGPTKWNDLLKPLYSCVMARLILSNVPAPIPRDLIGQAVYWKEHYNSHHKNAKGKSWKFIEEADLNKNPIPVLPMCDKLDLKNCKFLNVTNGKPKACGCMKTYERWNCEVLKDGKLVDNEADLVDGNNRLRPGNLVNCRRDVCCKKCTPGLGSIIPGKLCPECPFFDEEHRRMVCEFDISPV